MSPRKHFLQLLPIALLGLLASTDAAAYLTNPGNCTTDSVTIKTIEKSPLDGNGVIFSSPPASAINASSCFGLVEGNDSGNLSNPNPNIGQLGDGLLNGQRNIISPTQFINSSQLLDLDKNGTATDPGWIYLGKVESGGANTWSGHDKPLNIDDILDVTMTCTGSGSDSCKQGTWTLETSLDIIKEVQQVLGRNAFDHLAFVIKAGNRYAIYDFDFNIIAESLIDSGLFDFTTPYSFTGNWDTGDFPNPNGNNTQNMSHISLWARDPLPTNNVPAPGTLALTALGFIVLSLSMRRQKR